MDILNQSLEELINAGGFDCACGRHHSCGLKYFEDRPRRGAVPCGRAEGRRRHEGLYHLR